MTLSFITLAVFLVGTVAAGQTPREALEGTAWRAVELAGTPVSAQSPGDREPHLVFGAAGRVSGADGCNQISGPYTVTGNGITFGQLAGTQMFCVRSEEITRRFQAALKETSHWKVAAGRLEFYGATLALTLALTRAKCPEGSLHDQIVKQWASVRSFVIKDGHLFLSLLADGGIYEFEPLPSKQP